MALGAPVAHRFVPSSGSTAMSTTSNRTSFRPCKSLALTRPTFSPMNSIGASSRSPSPMTIVPSIGTVSITRRIVSTATWSDLWRSPWPIVWAQAIAACSTTRRNSSERSESIKLEVASRFRLFTSGIRGKFAAGRPIGAIAEEVVGLHDLVDLARAFVNDGAFAVAEEPAHWIFVRVAVRAVNLDRVARGALGGDRGEPLGEPGLARVALPLVLEPAGSHPQQPRRLVVRFHLRDHFLHQLVLADLDAERLPLLRVLHAGIAAGADQAGGARGHRIAALVEREHRDLEAFAFASEQVLRRHLDIVHLEEAGIAGEDAPLLLHRTAGEAFERPLDDERAETARVALFLFLGVGPPDHEEVIGDIGKRDPALLAVQDIAIALLHRGGLNGARVAAGARCSEAGARQLVALRLRDEVARLLILVAPRQEREAVQAGVHGHDDAQRGIEILELFARDPERDVVHAGAAVFLRHGNPEQTEPGHPAENPIAVEVVFAVVLADEWRDVLRAPLANGLLEQAMFVVESEINHVR